MIKKGIATALLAALIAVCPLTVWAGITSDNFVPCMGKAASDAQRIVYQIKTGDTIWGISRRYGIDVGTILAVNNLSEDSILQEGQLIDIPRERRRLHRVVKGQTLWKISRMYGVSLESIKKANPALKNPDSLQVGQLITIPPGAALTPTALSESSRGWQEFFSWPISGIITSGYCKRRGGFHHGLDIASPLKAPIKAAAAGRVVFAGYKRVYGRTVIINHPNGMQTIYGHASRILVKKGQWVRRGQIIARVGVSGRTTGPHLHFEVRRGNQTVNPVRYLKTK